MQYPDRVNYKGLLAINEDKTVHHKKLGYYAVQHVTALFDDTVRRVKDLEARVSGGEEESKFAVFGYRGAAGGSLLTLWRSSDTPGKRPEFERVSLTVDHTQFENPVWIDLLTGRVYEIDDALWNAADHDTVFTDLVVYDSVAVIADYKEIAGLLAPTKTDTRSK